MTHIFENHLKKLENGRVGGGGLKSTGDNTPHLMFESICVGVVIFFLFFSFFNSDWSVWYTLYLKNCPNAHIYRLYSVYIDSNKVFLNWIELKMNFLIKIIVSIWSLCKIGKIPTVISQTIFYKYCTCFKLSSKSVCHLCTPAGAIKVLRKQSSQVRWKPNRNYMNI